MPRRRMVDPEIWGDKWFGSLDYFEQIFFIGIISNSDDEGRILADPVYLRSRIFIYKDVSVTEVETMLTKFANTNKNFCLYNVNGDVCGSDCGNVDIRRGDRKGLLGEGNLFRLPTVGEYVVVYRGFKEVGTLNKILVKAN